MLDLKFIRENAEIVKKAVRDKNENVDIDKLLELDSKRRSLISRLDNLRRERNRLSSLIGKLVKEGVGQAMELKSEARALSEEIKALEVEESALTSELRTLLSWVPNIPDRDIPIGRGHADNVVVKKWGEAPRFSFEPKDHVELGTKLGILDFPRASKIAGAFFPLYKGPGARLERALITFMLNLHTQQNGYTELFPPFLANSDSMFATGQIPKLSEDMYYLPDDNLYLIPTGEVPLTNYHKGEILREEELPIKYAAYTPCFRREAGSYGKETRGLIRVHQFNKVELVKLTLPEESDKELESLLADAESVLQALGLHYRVVLLCTGELSFSAVKCYDIEIWSPVERKYLEVSSCSNFRDFQARRANIRLRRKDGTLVYPHTLNGSGVATARLLVALLETYQTARGTIIVPEPLRPYLGGLEEIE